MEILLGMHNIGERELCAMLVGPQYKVLVPKLTTAQNIICYLDEKRPHKVLMDVNYGFPQTMNITPFLEVAAAMKERGYNLDESLLGISGKVELSDLVAQHNLPFVQKPDTQNKVTHFVTN